MVSLRGRLWRQFLLLGVLPVLAVATVSVWLIAPVLVTQAEARNRDLALALRDQMQLQLDLRQRSTQLVASLMDSEVVASDQIGQTLASILRSDASILAAYATDARGIIRSAALPLGSGRFVEDLVDIDLSERDYYGRARSTGQAAWSNTFLSTLTGQVTAVLTAPARAGSVVIEYSLEGLSRSLTTLAADSTVQAIVLDRLGRVIAHPDPTMASRQESLANLPIVQRALAGESASERTSIGSERYFARALPVPGVGWTVLALQPVDGVLAPLRQLATLLTTLLGLVVALAVGMGWVLARRTGLEVSRLRNSAEAAAEQAVEAPHIAFNTTEFHQVWLRLRELFAQLHVRDQQTQSARQDLQAVLDAATEVAIIATDNQGTVTVFNIGAQRMLGLEPGPIVGHATPMRWHDAAEVEARAVELSRKHGHPLEGFEALVIEARHGGYEVRDWTFHRADGRRVEVSLAVTSMRTPGGDLKGFLGVAVDITQRRRAAELEVSRRTAELANQTKSDFLSRVSHELRSPLNAMLGYAQLIEMDAKTPPQGDQRERLQHIQRAGWHLVQLIDDVLDLSRIESGSVKVSLEPVDLVAAVARAQELLVPEIARGQVSLRVVWPDRNAEDAPHVMADVTRLTQVLVNLIGNAVKYNRPGGTVTLTAEMIDDRVALQVKDSGRGMTPAQLQRLFQPFDRLGLESSGIPGTGIGLVITRRLVDLMQGTMAVDSDAGVGSTFTLSLPRAMATSSEPAASPVPLMTAGGGSPQRMRVLYVEDNEVNAQLMRAVLRQRPAVDLRIAGTVADGLAQIRDQRPQLILLDMHLPDGSGHDLLTALAVDPDASLRDVEVIVVSADATEQQRHSTLARGVRGYLTKPIDVVDVLRAIDKALSNDDRVN
jgi:PAS domain S-box-containing protein